MAETRERAINAPWPAVALIAALWLAYPVQVFVLPDLWVEDLALIPADLAKGAWWQLVSHIFLHASVMHLLANSSAALAFGPPVARLMGTKPLGALAFFGFFLLCGALAGLGYVLPHWGQTEMVVGASGAVSGLWGAASRLIRSKKGPRPLFSRVVLMQAAAFVFVNVIVAAFGWLSNLQVAWEAHLAGYLVGMVLIGPIARRAMPLAAATHS